MIPGRTLHLVQTPAPRTQHVGNKPTVPPDLQVQVLQLPALAKPVMPEHMLDLLQMTAKIGQTLLRLTALTALSGPPALPLKTAVAWYAALARSPPATTTLAPHIQAVGIKKTAAPDLQVQVLQPPALAKPVIQAPTLDLIRLIAPHTQAVGNKQMTPPDL